MDNITLLTIFIGIFVIAAAIYLNGEKAQKKTTYTPTTPTARDDPEPEGEDDAVEDFKPAPKPAKSSKKKSKSKSKKKSKKVQKLKKERREAQEAARLAKIAAETAEEQAKKTKKDKKTDTISGTTASGTSGMIGASYRGDKADNDGWEVVDNAPKASSPRKDESKDDGKTRAQIPCSNLGKLIGKGGETIRRLSEESGAKIDTPERGSGSDLVTVSGSAEEVAAATAAIKELLGDDAAAAAAAPKFSGKHTVNNIGKLIGKGGSTIRGLSEEHSVRIDTPKGRKAQGNIVTVSGQTQEAVDAAIEAIKELLGDDDATPQVTKSIKLKASQRPLIIGRGGATIRKLQEDSGATRINVDRDSGDCKIIGSQEAVDKAFKAITAIIKKDESMVTQTLKCESSRFGLVIGRGGATIREISEEFKVKIDTDKATNLIKIRGDKKGVKGAIAKYTTILKKEESGPFGPLAEGAKSKIVAVPDALKGRIIGSGGQTIKKLTAETGAKIDFARRSEKGTDLGCRVSGTDEQIAAAEKAIEEIKAKAKEAQEKAEAARAARADDEEKEEVVADDGEFVGMADDATGTGW